MHIRSYTTIFSQALWFIVLSVCVSACAAFFFALTRPVDHIAVLAFELSFINRPAPQDYQYGGYYEQKSSEMYTQHLMSLFKNPAALAEMYEDAGIAADHFSGDALMRKFTVKQHSNQQFVVEFSDPNQEVARNLSNSMITAIVASAHSSGAINGTPQYAVRAEQPFFFESRRNPWKAGFVGALIGVIASCALIGLREYLK